MRNKIKQIIRIAIVICMVVLCLCVYPFCLVRRDTDVDPSIGIEYAVTQEAGNKLVQTFVAQEAYLSELVFDINFPEGIPEQGTLLVRIYEADEQDKVIFEKTLTMQEVGDSRFTYVTVKKWLKKNELYAYALSYTGEKSAVFQAVYTENAKDSTPGNQHLFLEEQLVEGQAVTRYVYGYPLNFKNVLCIWAFLIACGLILLELFTGEQPSSGNKLSDKLLGKVDIFLLKWQFPILIFEFIIVLLLLVRIACNETVHWDEAYTWQMVTKNTLSQMLKATAVDVHPPLYYMLVMGAMKLFGQNIFVAKMVSVAATAASGLLGITLVRKRWGVKTAIPYIGVVGLAPQMVYYSVDVRMYSWVCFFVIAAALFAYEIMDSGKLYWWGAFTLMALGGVYTQYFAVVPLAILYIFLLVWILVCDRKQFVKWIGCCVATIVGYLPWLGVVMETLQRDAASQEGGKIVISMKKICEWAFETNIEYSTIMPAVLFVLLALGLVCRWKRYERKQKAFIVLSGCMLFGVLLLCYLLSMKMNHFWDNRYMVDALLFVWLFMLIMLSRRKLITWGVTMIWLGIMLLSSYTVMQAKELGSIPWVNAARNVLEQVQEEEKIVYTFPTFDVLYEYYIPNAEFVWFDDVDVATWDMESFYLLDWGGIDFPWFLYDQEILEKQLLGNMKFEEGIYSDLWKIKINMEKRAQWLAE